MFETILLWVAFFVIAVIMFRGRHISKMIRNSAQKKRESSESLSETIKKEE